MFSHTLFHGNSANCWNTTARSGPGASTTTPPTFTVPVLGNSRPATIRMQVVLPQPDGPTIATNSFSRIVRSMPSSVRKSLPSRVKTRRTPVEHDVAHLRSIAAAQPPWNGSAHRPRLRLMAASARRSSTSIRMPTTPMAIIPAITVDVLMLLCPLTIR